MVISAKETTKALRRFVYPLLKAEGFDDWTSRCTWRRKDGRIDHVEFRSFSSYFAERFDCTSASVNVWLGIQVPELVLDRYGAQGPKGPRPREWQMPIRAALAPSLGLQQRNPLGIWNITSVGDAEACALDIAEQLRSYGLAWMNKLLEASELLGLLLQDESMIKLDTMPNGAKLWVDAGGPDSPNRNRKIAELARSQGNYALAADRFERARWARAGTADQHLFLPPEIDGELLALSQECARLASEGEA
jgi:hypothetical protein